METLREILDPEFLLRNSLYIGLLVGLACPLVGVYLILRRLIFLGVALPQISSCGIAAAFALHTWHIIPHLEESSERSLAFFGSTIFTLVTILALSWMERRGRVHLSRSFRPGGHGIVVWRYAPIPLPARRRDVMRLMGVRSNLRCLQGCECVQIDAGGARDRSRRSRCPRIRTTGLSGRPNGHCYRGQCRRRRLRPRTCERLVGRRNRLPTEVCTKLRVTGLSCCRQPSRPPHCCSPAFP